MALDPAELQLLQAVASGVREVKTELVGMRSEMEATKTSVAVVGATSTQALETLRRDLSSEEGERKQADRDLAAEIIAEHKRSVRPSTRGYVGAASGGGALIIFLDQVKAWLFGAGGPS